jgi:hypothetical protein
MKRRTVTAYRILSAPLDDSNCVIALVTPMA